MSDAIDLDHIALAFEHAFDGLDRYRGDLGGTYLGGAIDPGFFWGQVRYANGMNLELLEPAEVERDDFLRRFLDRNGPGPHHLTFKVPDIEVALERVSGAGFEPVRVNFEVEAWKELFLHPKQSHGIVVQLAQSAEEHAVSNDGLPGARSGPSAELAEIVLLVANLDAALALFAGVLDGEQSTAGNGGGSWVRLAWPGPGRLRLWQPERPQELEWLGGRIGRIHHVAFRVAEPDAIRGARALGDGSFEITPEDNLGTRLRLERA